MDPGFPAGNKQITEPPGAHPEGIPVFLVVLPPLLRSAIQHILKSIGVLYCEYELALPQENLNAGSSLTRFDKTIKIVGAG
jgi:hypothetical protein